jgi:hypothetical protein
LKVNLMKNPILMVIGILALAIIISFGCAKTPKAPDTSIRPQTIITSYNISTAPDTATLYGVTVYWRASEVAGQAESYRYWVDGGDTTYTFDTSTRVLLNFNETDTMHVFDVEARDNQGNWDPSPAIADINIYHVRIVDQFAPTTTGATVPPPGTLTSRGVKLVVNGSSLDGNIPNFQWAINDTSVWTTVPATLILPTGSTVELVLDTTVISLGPHIVFVRAVDNFGVVDQSPVTVSFVAVDTLRPDLTVVSGPIPHAFYFLPGGSTTVDLAATWFGDAAWYYSTLQFRYAVDDTSLWSPWTDGTTCTLTGLTAGAHAFSVEAMDLAGHTSLFQASFGIGQLVGDRGILVVNGIDWASYNPQASNMYLANVPFGTHSFDFWDFFAPGSGVRPANVEARLIGEGAAIPGDTLGHYSSIVMLMNNFSAAGPSDLDYYTTMFPLILSYLHGGGNVALGCRYGATFITGDLLTYGISSGTLNFNNVGVNPTTLVAVAPGLVDVSRTASSSLTDLLETPLPTGVTNLFNVNNYPGSSGGILIEPQTGGKFVFIAGRPYRFDFAPESANYDYILTNYFGEH